MSSAARQGHHLSRKPAGGVEVRRRGRHRGEFGDVAPVHMPLGEPARPIDGRCRCRSSKTVRCEPPKRWFVLPMLSARLDCEGRRRASGLTGLACSQARAGTAMRCHWQNSQRRSSGASPKESVRFARGFLRSARPKQTRKQHVPPLNWKAQRHSTLFRRRSEDAIFQQLAQ